MINFGDAQYVSYLRIGRQILAGMLDTGSFDLVVFGASCRTCGVAAHYNPSLSTTFLAGRLVSQQAYGSGSCYSTVSSDVLQIGPFPETTQSFWTVQQASMPVLSSSAFEAILGLGPPEAPLADAWKAVTAAIANYFDMAERAPGWAQAQVDKRLGIADEVSGKPTLLRNLNVTTFSVCMGSVSRSNGIFVWNDAEAVNQPSLFVHVPVTGLHTWSTQLTNPTLVSASPGSANASAWPRLGCGPERGCSAILDTGMSLIAAPKSVVDGIREAAAGLKPDCSNVAELPELSFELGGQRFTLPPEAYVAQLEGTVPDYLAGLIVHDSATMIPMPRCQLLLLESAATSRAGPLWILGMPFFRKYYTTFNIGTSRDERSLRVAHAGQDCSPAGAGEEPAKDRASLLRRVELQKVHLPQTARIAMREQFVSL
eukprot:CAMPEP_0168429526 /NCGR_PEP_ID=MMETSP0228-20121227/37415_1 /TAXON_ID=133427 /ORGANISM="Protoceratium reticulatum, Strain CCCM 535 (=CCMP 1889)" /LENGTH=426 /DNA_ID=CAMNT_0008443613 /DNA_START=17 /DNA_END=1298 /DNA_ORIENTATION=+